MKTIHFDIIYEVEMLHPAVNNEGMIVAATYKGREVPEGQLLPSEKDVLIDSQVLADYHSFIESVEDLISDYYDLEIYYKNDSPYNSFYFGMLAKNSDGSLLFDFDFTLRISNHDPHRTKQSQHYKREKKAALKRLARNKKPTPMTASVIVNDVEYEDYLDAYVDIDAEIERAVEVMTRKKK